MFPDLADNFTHLSASAKSFFPTLFSPPLLTLWQTTPSLPYRSDKGPKEAESWAFVGSAHKLAQGTEQFLGSSTVRWSGSSCYTQQVFVRSVNREQRELQAYTLCMQDSVYRELVYQSVTNAHWCLLGTGHFLFSFIVVRTLNMKSALLMNFQVHSAL